MEKMGIMPTGEGVRTVAATATKRIEFLVVSVAVAVVVWTSLKIWNSWTKGPFALDDNNMFTARLAKRAKRAKVMFSQASVCPTQGGLPSWQGLPSVGGGGWLGAWCWGLTTYPRTRHLHPPGPDTYPQDQAPTPHRTRHLPPPSTVNARAVRILLECILVLLFFLSTCVNSNFGNHVTHFKRCVNDIKSLCCCRQVQNRP